MYCYFAADCIANPIILLFRSLCLSIIKIRVVHPLPGSSESKDNDEPYVIFLKISIHSSKTNKILGHLKFVKILGTTFLSKPDNILQLYTSYRWQLYHIYCRDPPFARVFWRVYVALVFNKCVILITDKGIVSTVVYKRLWQTVVFEVNPVRRILCNPIGWRLQKVGSSSPMSSRHRNLEPLGRWHATIFMDIYSAHRKEVLWGSRSVMQYIYIQKLTYHLRFWVMHL